MIKIVDKQIYNIKNWLQLLDLVLHLRYGFKNIIMSALVLVELPIKL